MRRHEYVIDIDQEGTVIERNMGLRSTEVTIYNDCGDKDAKILFTDRFLRSIRTPEEARLEKAVETQKSTIGELKRKTQELEDKIYSSKTGRLEQDVQAHQKVIRDLRVELERVKDDIRARNVRRDEHSHSFYPVRKIPEFPYTRYEFVCQCGKVKMVKGHVMN